MECSGLRFVQNQDRAYRYHIVQPDGLPELFLTLFANELARSLSEASVPAYLREVVSFANWTSRDAISRTQGWHLYGKPHEVRNALREYLSVGTKCKLTTRPDTLGVKVTYVQVTRGTKINVPTLLVALKRLYGVLIAKRLYAYENPLVHPEAADLVAELRGNYRRAIFAIEGRAPMPAVSGVDPPSGVRLSENYFRCIQARWMPQSIDDPDFPRAVYAAGKLHGWGLREFCVVRTLFESGARISEVLTLMAQDWSVSHFMNRFRAQNKGSHGVRVKQLVVSQLTAKLCRRYFDDPHAGRRAHAPDRLTLHDLTKLLESGSEQLAETPLYLTNRGTAMSAKLFRDYYWAPALHSAGIDADPHQTRHWFVTNALRTIERAAKSEAELRRKKEELIQYMAWRSGDRTLQAYEHVQRKEDFAATLNSIHRSMQRRERSAPHAASKRKGHEADANPPMVDPDLAFLLGEDNDD